MKISYVLLVLSLISCSQEGSKQVNNYSLEESRSPSLVVANNLFTGEAEENYPIELESGILVEGDNIWQTFTNKRLGSNCSLFDEFFRLSKSKNTGEGAMILSPFERFFVLGDNKNRFYGVSVKLSDNTIKIERVYRFGDKKEMYRTSREAKDFIIADIEYIEKFYPCINTLIKDFYNQKRAE